MPPSLQLFTAASGKRSAKIVFEDNCVRHLHSTVRPESEAELYENLQWYGDVVVFAGFGFGWHMRNALATLPPRAKCIVIDYFDECLSHAKETLFCGLGNKVVFVNANDAQTAKRDISSFLGARADSQSSLQIVKHPASFDCFRQTYEPLVDHIARLAVPARRPSSAKIGKALVFFGDFFLEEEVRRGLVENRIEPVLFKYKTFKGGIDFEDSLARQIQYEKPDFIFSINMKGWDGNGETGRLASRFGVPVAVWFVDDPRPILLSGRANLCPGMLALCWEKEYTGWLKSAGFSRVEYMPLAADPSLFQPRSPIHPVTRVGFVGTSMVDRYGGNIKEKFLWTESLSPLASDIALKLAADPFFNVFDAIPAAAEKLGINLGFSDERNITWLAAYIIHTASMLKRKAIVGGLLDQGIETFGDPQGWKELLGPGIVTHPSIDYRHELSSVYQSIAVNVNVTSCQMPSAVNQRVFDIPLSGGFVVSDDQKDLHELFDTQEFVSYGSIDDLREKVAFFHENEARRRSITDCARKRILGEHTYKHRVQKIVSML